MEKFWIWLMVALAICLVADAAEAADNSGNETSDEFVGDEEISNSTRATFADDFESFIEVLQKVMFKYQFTSCGLLVHCMGHILGIPSTI